MPEGPLGFPRLTSFGPFSKKKLEEMVIDTQHGADLSKSLLRQYNGVPEWLHDSDAIAKKIETEYKSVANDLYESSKQHSAETASLLLYESPNVSFSETVIGDDASVNPLNADLDRQGRRINHSDGIGFIHTHPQVAVDAAADLDQHPTLGESRLYPSLKDLRNPSVVQGDVIIHSYVAGTIAVGGERDREGSVFTYFNDEARQIGLIFGEHFDDLTNEQVAQLYSVFLEDHVSTFEI